MTLIVGNKGAHRARFFKAFRWQAQKVRDAYMRLEMVGGA